MPHDRDLPDFRDSADQALTSWDKVTAGRVPPHNLEAEAAVISAALLDKAAADVVVDELEKEHFYSDANGLIMQAIVEVRAKRLTVDAVSVVSQLRARQQAQRIGGATYLAQLLDATPAVANVSEHCTMVREAWQKRQVIIAARAIMVGGYGVIPDHGEWIQECETAMFAATQRTQRRETATLAELAQAEYYATQHPEQDDGQKVLTGFTEFDKKLGLFRGDLMIIGARPGQGKSAAMQCLAEGIGGQLKADTSEPEFAYEVMIFGLEMPKEQLGQRALSQGSEVSLPRIRNRGGAKPFSKDDVAALLYGASTASAMVTVDDTPALTLAAVCARSRRWVAEVRGRGREPGTIIVDYLQLMSGRKGAKSREQEISNCSRGLKGLAKELRTPVIALSQLNRGLESRTQKRPVLSDLRESGAIEQDADMVMMIHRDGYFSNKARQDIGEWIVPKVRNGQPGTIEMGWKGWCTKWVERSQIKDPEPGQAWNL